MRYHSFMASDDENDTGPTSTTYYYDPLKNPAAGVIPQHGNYYYYPISATISDSQNNSTDLIVIINHHMQAFKSVLLVALFAATLTTSLMPFILRRAALHSRTERKRQIFVSLFSHMSCFGGGVFLATCLLDLLPDAREVLQRAFFPTVETTTTITSSSSIGTSSSPNSFHSVKQQTQQQRAIAAAATEIKTSPRFADFPLAEFLTAFGFLLVLFAEQIFVWFKDKEWSSGGNSGHYYHRHRNNEDDRADEGHVAEHRHASVDDQPIRRRSVAYLEAVDPISASSSGRTSQHHTGHVTPRIGASSADTTRASGEEMNEFEQSVDTAEIAQDVHFDPESHSTSRVLLLLAALCLHSTFEGLALGLQRQSGVALQIFAALCIHKSIIGFSLGIRLVQSKLTNRIVALCCLTFSLTTPIGGVLGLLITQEISGGHETPTACLINGCLQGVACGTFLYITSFEILPHELNIGPGGHNRLTKLLMLVFGFSVICAFLMFWPQ